MAGRDSVAQVMVWVERLLDEPWSRYRAKLLGGDNWRQHLGWGPGEYLSAALIDAVNTNTAVTAAHGSGRQPKAPERFHRPEPKPAEASARSLDALPLAAIEAMINN